MITTLGVVLVVAVVVLARYAAAQGDADDTRPPAPDVRLFRAVRDAATRHWAAHRRGWEIYDRALRPWERRHPGEPHPVTVPRRIHR